MLAEAKKWAVAAERLRSSYGGKPILPLRDILEPTDVDGAYTIQAINTDIWVQQGRRIVGRKIGLTAKTVQKQLGVEQPDFGVLFDDMQLQHGGTLDPLDVIQPKAEAEVAFVLGRDLAGADTTPESVASAIDYAVAAIEIVDSRIADWRITFADTVADNGSSAFFVLGEDRRLLRDLDLYSCGMVLELNSEIASIGAGAACLGHPLKAAAWLVSTLGKMDEGLQAGDVLLSGALGPMVALTPGDHVKAVVGGIGHVEFNYGDRSS